MLQVIERSYLKAGTSIPAMSLHIQLAKAQKSFHRLFQNYFVSRRCLDAGHADGSSTGILTGKLAGLKQDRALSSRS